MGFDAIAGFSHRALTDIPYVSLQLEISKLECLIPRRRTSVSLKVPLFLETIGGHHISKQRLRDCLSN